MSNRLQFIAPTPALKEAAEKKTIIPDPDKMLIEESFISKVLDWALIIEIIYGIPEMMKVISGEGSPWGVYAFLALCVTLIAITTLPDKMMMQEVQKPGVPIREIVQFGTHIWPEQTKVVDVKPLTKPENPIKLDEISTQLDGNFTILDNRGNEVALEDLHKLKEAEVIFKDSTGREIDFDNIRELLDTRFTVRDAEGHDIIRGRWITPELADEHMKQMIEERLEDGEKPEEWKRYLERIWMRKWTIAGSIILGFTVWLFWTPLVWLVDWLRSGVWIWW